jgi:DNA-binding NarL/FixJ family response regulator
MQKINVLIVDDHPIVIAGIENLLNTQPNIEHVYSAANGKTALELIASNPVDVVLLDINLPDINGIDLCKKLLEVNPTVNILGMSTLGDYSYISRLIQNGAVGYIIKNASAHEIIEGITAVMNGEKYFSTEVQAIISSNMYISAQIPKLTRREKEILEHLANGQSNQEIAEALFLSPLTVDTHRKNLLAKFEVKNTVLLLKKATEYGLI